MLGLLSRVRILSFILMAMRGIMGFDRSLSSVSILHHQVYSCLSLALLSYQI